MRVKKTDFPIRTSIPIRADREKPL